MEYPLFRFLAAFLKIPGQHRKSRIGINQHFVYILKLQFTVHKFPALLFQLFYLFFQCCAGLSEQYLRLPFGTQRRGKMTDLLNVKRFLNIQDFI